MDRERRLSRLPRLSMNSRFLLQVVDDLGVPLRLGLLAALSGR